MTFRVKHIIATCTVCVYAACSPSSPKTSEATRDASAATLGAFEAAGSEPFWSAKWDEKRLSLEIGIEKDRVEFENPTLVKIPNGWQILSDGLSMTVDTSGCQNMAGETQSYEITASVKDVKLIGCGDPA